MMQARAEQPFMCLGRVAVRALRPFRLVHFIFIVILSTVGLAQNRRNALLDTLDARHDKSKPLLERLAIMSQHAEALFAQGRMEEREANAKEYMVLAQEVGTDSVLAQAYGLMATVGESGGRTSTRLDD